MFCRTLMCGKRPYPWNTMLVGRFSGPSRVTSTPPISTEPVVGSDEAADDPEQRGLAAAGRTEDRDEIAAIDLQVERPARRRTSP